MESPENNNFTALRLALALLVVFGHFILLPSDAPTYGPFAYADFAVATFFVVSGYLIYMSFDRQPLIISFYIRRLFRIYPLYIAVVLLQGLVMAILAGGVFTHGSELLHYLALNFMMANFLAHDMGGLLSNLHNPGINPSLWTLKIEFAFYLVLPLLWVLIRRFGFSFIMLMYAASSAYAVIALSHGLDNYARQLPGQMRYFAVGIALYQYRSKLLKIPTWPLLFVAVAFVLCRFSPDSLALPFYPLGAGLVMYTCAFRLPRVKLPFDISYGVYLIHGPLIQFSLLLGVFQDTRQFLAMLVGSVLLLALLAEQMIEQPGIDMGKKLARGWNARMGKAGA